MKVLDLFSGIGAYALGVERAGMQVVAFCESEEFPRLVLRKHWPDVPIYEDVRTLTADTLRRDGIAVDVIVGGWPCQDISLAGTGAGLDGARSGLWSEIARLAGELRPAFLILENSSNLLASSPEGEPPGRDFGRVLGDLAALGYDAEWHCLPAAAFDAPHIRDRVWIVAHRRGIVSDVAWNGEPQEQTARGTKRQRVGARSEPARAVVADATRDGRNARRPRDASQEPQRRQPDRSGEHGSLPYPHGFPSFGATVARRERHTWEPEPAVDRVANGVADRVDRIHALGNCNPPIIPETIARAILAASDLKADLDILSSTQERK